MIVVRVELWSAITGKQTELARMHIINTGHGTPTLGSYVTSTLRGRSKADLDHAVINRSGEVLGYPRQRLHVWNLVASALASMKYSHGKSGA